MAETNELSLAQGDRVPALRGEVAMSAPAGAPSPNPIAIVTDRLEGRWRWVIGLALVLSPVAAVSAWFLSPVKYMAQGLVAIERRPDVNTIETRETQRLDDFAGFVSDQSVLLSSERVIQAALDDPRLKEPYAARIAEQGMRCISENLQATPVKGTGYVSVRVETEDPKFSAAAVNSLLAAYMRIAGGDPGTSLTNKLTANRESLAAIRRQMEKLSDDRLALIRSTPYGSPNLSNVVDDRVNQCRDLDKEIAMLEESSRRIRRAAGAPEVDPKRSDGSVDEAAAAQIETQLASARLEPTDAELEAVSPAYASSRRQLEQTRAEVDLSEKRYSEKHPILQQIKRRAELLTQQVESDRRAAIATWTATPGRVVEYKDISDRLARLTKEKTRVRDEIDKLLETMEKADAMQREITRYSAEETIFVERVKQLETESDTIRKGRVSIAQTALQPTWPSTDKRIPLAIVGALGGVLASFGVFFLVGTLDKRTYAASQLSFGGREVLLAGAIPDMDEDPADPGARDLATNCIHRIRTRIETRRTPGDGYVLMVTSPFQGDGKTTLAVALAWSYAESGHRTLLVDCDFIGQALTFQFSRIAEDGVREALQGADVSKLIHSLGTPMLSLLPAGRDRTFGASRLHPAALRRLFRELRDRYEIVIVDTGPVTASIEALPVASAVDGALLALRRGRSRGRLAECVADITSVGAEYLGVVLNCASRPDCTRYGSASRLSAEVAQSIAQGSNAPAPRHALLDAIRPSSDNRSAGAA
ncbi:MAG: AAA family ATPase [Phycisphaerales bacterium]